MSESVRSGLVSRRTLRWRDSPLREISDPETISGYVVYDTEIVSGLQVVIFGDR